MPSHRLSARLRLAPLALIAALLLGACGSDAPDAPSRADLDRVWKGEGAVIEVQVHELHCEKCEASAREAAGAVSGVERVEADHATDVVRIHLDAAADRYALIPALRDALHRIGKDIVGEDEIPAE